MKRESFDCGADPLLLLPDIQTPTGTVESLIESARRKGAAIWSENGQLRYKAPKGALSPEEIESFRRYRDLVAASLEAEREANVPESGSHRPLSSNRFPLAYSQLAHWLLFRLSVRHAIRQIACATRIRGRLNVDALRTSFTRIVGRHDALRTRIVLCHGAPVQEVAESVDCELTVDDLMLIDEELREVEVDRAIEDFVLQPIDVTVAPLFGVRLLRVRQDEHILIVAMQHMISDMFSLSIFLRELFSTYAQISTQRSSCLPEVQISFPRHALRQCRAERTWIEKHGPHWRERLPQYERLKFPEDRRLAPGVCSDWGDISVHIGKGLKLELREWCRRRGTTLAMSIFMVYAALVLRWCDVPSAVFRYITDGRTTADLENTIGFVASVLYPRIKLGDNDTFIDLLNQVTQEYCQAYEHNDFFYLSSRTPQPEFTRNPSFNWVPLGSKLDVSELDRSQDAITCNTVPLAHVMLRKLGLDQEPGILLYETDDEIFGGIHFPLNRLSADSMKRFARNFLELVHALLRQPDRRVKDVGLV